MDRFRKLLFLVSLLALSWYAMMAVHELGHIIGAAVSGGGIEKVVLHPLAISRTDVAPNPHPGFVVWLGPLVGGLLPLSVLAAVPRRLTTLHGATRFFAGFCLIANGAYVAVGSFGRVGDSGEMLSTGTPVWLMIAFGLVAASLGLYLWHGLGSLGRLLSDSRNVTPAVAYSAFFALILVVAAGITFSPR